MYNIIIYLITCYVLLLEQKSFDKSSIASVEKDVINDYMWNLNQQCSSDKYTMRRKST